MSASRRNTTTVAGLLATLAVLAGSPACAAAAGANASATPADAGAFRAAGISFAYPAQLTLSHKTKDGDEFWFFEDGDFSFALRTAASGSSARDYVVELGDRLTALMRGVGVTVPEPGRTLPLCGQPAQATVMSVKQPGGRRISVYEAFDLPPDASGRARMLVFTDQPNDDRPSATAAQTWDLVQRTLRCDGAAGDAPLPQARSGDDA